MKPFTPRSTINQLTDHLRQQILNREIRGTMPGINQLVGKLGVGTQTVIAALTSLEQEGLLESQGARQGRRIILDGSSAKPLNIKLEILLYETRNSQEGLLVDLRNRIEQAGHSAVFSSKSLCELKMDPDRVARYVEKSDADAWVVFVGSRPVLEWFASQPFPSFALLGRSRSVDMAGLTVSKTEAITSTLNRLAELGHSRIVLMSREERRKPSLGINEKHYLKELQRLGISTGAYNLPEWEDNVTSYHACLTALFRHTPPTAMLFDDPLLFVGAQQFFANHAIRIPKDVSTLVLDKHPAYAWCSPQITHLDMDRERWNQEVMRWLRDIAKQGENRRKRVVKAWIVEGGTIGKAP